MIVVNFSTPNYARGQQRLSHSLGDRPKIMFTSYEQIGSRTHSESPYEFKIAAIEKAFELDDIILWCDSSLYLVGDLTIIENLIKQDGYFLSEAGHWVNRWTNNFQRQYFNLTEEESKEPGGLFMFSAGLVGLDKNSKIAMEFFNQWKAAGLAGAFRGSWEDSRHEMTAGSIIAQRLGMKYQRGGQHMSYIGPGYSKPEPDSVFYLQGVV